MSVSAGLPLSAPSTVLPAFSRLVLIVMGVPRYVSSRERMVAGAVAQMQPQPGNLQSPPFLRQREDHDLVGARTGQLGHVEIVEARGNPRGDIFLAVLSLIDHRGIDRIVAELGGPQFLAGLGVD